MARRFDFTRFVTTTAVSITTFNLETMEAENDTMYMDGEPTRAEIEREAVKRYGKARINSVLTFGTMYGLTNEQVMTYGTALNPYTRQPWDNALTGAEKAEIEMQYALEQAEKKAAKQ